MRKLASFLSGKPQEGPGEIAGDKSVPSERPAPGRTVDEVGALVEHGPYRGVVIADLAVHGRRLDPKVSGNCRVRVAGGRIRVVPVKELKLINIVPSDFRLGELPTPALACVLLWMKLSEAAQLACLSKRFAAAFADNVAWKRRCRLQYTEIDVETTFAAEKHEFWMRFYKQHSSWKIHIVTVFKHRGGTSLSGSFEMIVNPCMSVSEFLDAVEKRPQNRQQGKPQLRPHNPASVGRRGPVAIVPGTVDDGPNCSFSVENLSATIADAGLRDGAILEQPERMMRD